MRIVYQNSREGVIKLVPDSLDDLWHLQHVLELGDLVTARTSRKTAVKRGSDIELGERRPITLTIELEKIDFHKYTFRLRLSGKIKEGPEDIQLASYHSIDVEPGTPLKIQKRWKNYHLERLQRARIRRPLLFLCLIDRDEADFFELRESGMESRGSIYFKKVKGKEDSREDYYNDVMEILEKQEHQNILVAGPGFEKENLLNHIKKQSPELAGRIRTEYASYSGKPGAEEVIKKSLNKILKQTRIAEETEAVEELLKRIGQNRLVCYKKPDIQEAITMGAVETLIVSQEKIKEFEEIMESAEKIAARILIISSDHESGEKLLGLGGMGAFLRFEIAK